MSWLSDFMHPGRAYDKAGQREQQGYNEAQGYRQPYMDNGIGAGNTLKEIMEKLKNPAALQDEWSKGYETSPYAKQLQEGAQTSGLDAASSMGLGGSSAALSNIQKGSSDIMQKDRQNYMDDLMKKYMGAMGIGESMYGTGANTAGAAATGAQSHGEWQGQNEFNKSNAGSNQFKSMIANAIKMAMAAAGAGGMGGGGIPGFSGMSSDMFGGS